MTDVTNSLTLPHLWKEDCGKASDRWSSYINVYDEMFSSFRDMPVRLLEIGIQNGGSLEIWSRYFGGATAIIGCDINPACAQLRYDDTRVHVFVGDAMSDAVAAQIEMISPTFDIVIDDGSHRSGDIINAFARYFPTIENGGLFIAEDLHCSYWAEFEGGLFDPFSSMSFFKRLADAINHEHWGVPSERASILQSFQKQYGIVFSEEALAEVHSVQFVNSMCLVRKRPKEENTLGERVVVGREEIAERLDARSGSLSIPANQQANAWSRVTPLPEDELLVLREVTSQQAGDLEKQAGTLHDQDLLLADVQRLADERARTLEEQSRIVDGLRRDLSIRSGQLQIAQQHSAEQQRCIGEQHAHLTMVNEDVAALQRLIEDRHRDLAAASGAAGAAIAAIDADRQEQIAALNVMRRSTSWRVSGPVRWAGLQLRRSRRTARLTARLAARPGGVSRLIRGCVYVLTRRGLGGFRTTMRDFEAEGFALTVVPVATLPPAPLPSKVVASSGDPREEIARQLYAEQQAELSPSAIAEAIASFADRPLISVLMPVYKTPVKWLRRAVESLQEQYYENWELCVVDDCSPGSEQRDALWEIAAADPRVRLTVMAQNGGISAASNEGLRMSRGKFVALLDHDDELPPDALFWIVEAINRQPETDFLYSDECKIDDTPARRLFHFLLKPDWSPELMFNGMMTGHLTVYRRELVEELDGFRSEFDFSQDYDLALRAGETARCIVHVERVLYLWRAIPGSAASGGKHDARVTNIGALNDALQRRGVPGQAFPLPYVNCVRLAIPHAETRVSIIIPSDSVQNLRLALKQIRAMTNYSNYQVVVVCNTPLAARLADEFFDWEDLTFARYDKPYNFSDKCNEGAKAASGDVLIFYNDDVFPLQGDWIERLIEYLWIDGVGGTSPKLLHENDTIQYAGMISGTPGLFGTAYNNVPVEASDPFLTLHRFVRNVSILSGACCALRKDVFWLIGGFDAENTPDGHSDADLSYKLQEVGLRCVYTPHALLRHIGNHSWGAKRRKDRSDTYMLRRWGSFLSRDPLFTDSMKRVLYEDFRFRYRIFAEHLDSKRQATGPHVLFVSHELSLTGAPRMLLYGARVVQEAGGFPVIVARQDGPFRREFVDAGIAVIIDESIDQNHFLFSRFARNFDLVVVNTIALAAVVRQLSAIENLRTVWWLHEARSLVTELQTVGDVQWARVQVLCNGAYSRQFVPEGISVELLRYGIPDAVPEIEEDGRGAAPVTFFLPGTVEPRKGQDIFVDAVGLLPPYVRRECRFILSGKIWEMHRGFWQAIEAKTAGLPEVSYLGLQDHQTHLRLLMESDVLVCASRDDPWPLVVIEGAMMRRAIILNENVGVGEMFDESSCFRFQSGSATSLAGQMLAAYEMRNELAQMGRVARRVFERELTLQAFSDRFLQMVERQVAANATGQVRPRLIETVAAEATPDNTVHH